MLKSKADLITRNNPNPKGCNYFVPRKKRFCRLLVKIGERYCAEHTLSTSEKGDSTNIDDGPLRVVCPLDNKQ